VSCKARAKFCERIVATETMKEKNPHPVIVRLFLYALLTLWIYASYLIFAVVQFDLWLLVKRNGLIPRLVRWLTVLLGLLFLIACLLGIENCSLHYHDFFVSFQPDSHS
jgi:hypothetical protein